MSQSIDAKTLELISSKICHDLISPIGAINNGVEIFEEMGADGADDVIALIAASAQLAAAKLKAYRIAYGAGGSDSTIQPKNAHTVVEEVLAHEKRTTQDWDANTPFTDNGENPIGLAKIITAYLLLMIECLPRGGVISAQKGDGHTLVISAKGTNPLLKENFEGCLRQTVSLEDLSPALTHAFMTGFLAIHYGFTLNTIVHNDDELTFTINMP